MSRKKVEAEVKEEVKAQAEEVKTEVKEEVKEAKKEKIQAPKKTKAELNKEMKAAIVQENTSRTDRNRAEKAARRAAKASRKEAHVVEDKKRRMGNGVLALMIFGVVALMFVFVWGYNYFSKAVSIESYIADNGGKETYSNMMMSENTTMSVTAEKNDMKVVIDMTADEGSEDMEYFKSDESVDVMKYYASYWLASIEPLVRGNSATATVVGNVNGKKSNTVTVDWSEVDGILEKYGMSVESIQKQVAQQATATTDDVVDATDVTETEGDAEAETE